MFFDSIPFIAGRTATKPFETYIRTVRTIKSSFMFAHDNNKMAFDQLQNNFDNEPDKILLHQ